MVNPPTKQSRCPGGSRPRTRGRPHLRNRSRNREPSRPRAPTGLSDHGHPSSWTCRRIRDWITESCLPFINSQNRDASHHCANGSSHSIAFPSCSEPRSKPSSVLSEKTDTLHPWDSSSQVVEYAQDPESQMMRKKCIELRRQITALKIASKARSADAALLAKRRREIEK